MSGSVAITFESVQEASQAAIDTGAEYIDLLNKLESRVMSMDWTGKARESFDSFFNDMKGELESLQEQFDGLGDAIKAAGEAYQETDDAIASSFG